MVNVVPPTGPRLRGDFRGFEQFCIWADEGSQIGASSCVFSIHGWLAFTLLEAAQIALTDHGLRFDFDQIVADQPTDLEHRIGRADRPKRRPCARETGSQWFASTR